MGITTYIVQEEVIKLDSQCDFLVAHDGQEHCVIQERQSGNVGINWMVT